MGGKCNTCWANTYDRNANICGPCKRNKELEADLAKHKDWLQKTKDWLKVTEDKYQCQLREKEEQFKSFAEKSERKNNDLNNKISELEQTVSYLRKEKEHSENSLREQVNHKQNEINQIKINYEDKISKLTDELEEFSSELLEIKKNELNQIINDYKSKLEEVYHGYLESFIKENSKIAKNQLLKKFDEKALKDLSEKQQAIDYLEEKVNKLSQQTNVEVLPPSYN